MFPEFVKDGLMTELDVSLVKSENEFHCYWVLERTDMIVGGVV
jgi:hypothetical protein